MDGTDGRRARRSGRRVRLLQGLYIAAAMVVVVAVWQFIVVAGGGREPGSGWAGLDPLFGRDEATSAVPSEAVSTRAVSPTAPQPSAGTGPTAVESAVGDSGGGGGGDDAGGASPGTTPSMSSSPDRPDEASSATPAPPPGCTARLRLDGSWRGAFQATVEVVNDTEERIDGWEVVLDLEDAEVTAAWGLRHVEGHRWGNVFWNGGLGAGQSTTATFHAATDVEPSLPATVPCSVV